MVLTKKMHHGGGGMVMLLNTVVSDSLAASNALVFSEDANEICEGRVWVI